MKELSKNINAQEITGKHADENFINSQITFALKLFQNIINKSNSKQNILISAYSVVQALGMIANGANGSTKTQIEKTISNMPIEDFNQYLYMHRISQPNTKNCKLMTANSIWIRDNEFMQIKKDFLQTNANYYNSSIFTDLFDDSTVTDINKWVNKHTNTMIPKLLDEISDKAILYLINTVAFHAKWQNPYELYQVQNGKFKNANGKEQTVKMMHSMEDDYLEDEYAIGFLKYYQGGCYAFMALLPNKNISVIE
ncbi:MAG: serine protease, partial [Oscillospiraceae bacterium]|nr:serine protease [Oscillospiraceae bacterium]